MNGTKCFNNNIEQFRSKMREKNTHPITIQTFERYYKQLCTGQTGVIQESILEPVRHLKTSHDLIKFTDHGIDSLKHTVVIKLNGGLGTSMGLNRAKSLLHVKPELSFLDIIIGQIQRIRADYNAAIPLVFMNSDNTRQDTLKYLEKYPDLVVEGIVPDFLQSRIPKIRQKDYLPAEYPSNPEMEWNPPGHGDIYYALLISNLLERMLHQGYRYAFVSNADNLGAELCPSTLGYFAANQFSLLMEVAERTDADRKGGHLARHKDGHLLLREKAQCKEEDQHYFSDIQKYRYFNTNTIWIHLGQLHELLHSSDCFLNLPLICNKKTVNPLDPKSDPVFQMETAMGSAISTFGNTTAVCVPRSRFIPVKTTDDLIGLWSDAYCVSDAFRVTLCPSRKTGVISSLDDRFYRTIGQLLRHFPFGAPSLKECREWVVTGEFIFEKDIVIKGSPRMVNTSESPHVVPAGTVIDKDYIV
jgi:UTP--glucose-1-phosphate uridylyltransferase